MLTGVPPGRSLCEPRRSTPQRASRPRWRWHRGGIDLVVLRPRSAKLSRPRATFARFDDGPPNLPPNAALRKRTGAERERNQAQRSPRCCRSGHDFHPIETGGRPLGCEPFRSGRDPQAALGPACLEHRPAGAGAHAVAKAVTLGSATGIRLERTLHEYFLLRLARLLATSGLARSPAAATAMRTD
jgi:hypothetical protein